MMQTSTMVYLPEGIGHFQQQQPSQSTTAARPVTFGSGQISTAEHRPTKRQCVGDDDAQQVSSSDAASVLFKHTEASSKKHTRPPISSLFSSIELPPEQFLKLQALVKDFMLDEAHSERQDTVGMRGKGNSELVKLRLWNCAKDFVEKDGNGERFFGPQMLSHLGGARSMIWPQDKKKIITALIPLLRRVITNERQRQYALEARGKTQTTEEKSTEMGPSGVPWVRPSLNPCTWNRIDYKIGTLFNEFTNLEHSSYTDWKDYRNSPEIVRYHTLSGITAAGFDEMLAIFDHHLRLFHSESNLAPEKCSRPCENSVVEGIVDSYPEVWECGHWGFSEVDMNLCDKSMGARVILHDLYHEVKVQLGHIPPPERSTASPASQSYYSDQDSDTSHVSKYVAQRAPYLSLRVSLLEGDQDVLLSRHELPASDIPFIHTLLQKVCQCQPTTVSMKSRVYVHLPDGLRLIEDDKSWTEALSVAQHTIWFGGQANVVIRTAALNKDSSTP